jgi:hypothetical protein
MSCFRASMAGKARERRQAIFHVSMPHAPGMCRNGLTFSLVWGLGQGDLVRVELNVSLIHKRVVLKLVAAQVARPVRLLHVGYIGPVQQGQSEGKIDGS